MGVAGGTAHQLLPQGHPLLGAGAWSKYHCAVTRHKDSEPHSVASRLDGYHPEAPAVSLDSFLDGDRAAMAAPSHSVSPSSRGSKGQASELRMATGRGHYGIRLPCSAACTALGHLSLECADISLTSDP